jgi:hypothetical protein
MADYTLHLFLPPTPGVVGRDSLPPITLTADGHREAKTTAQTTIYGVQGARTVVEAHLVDANVEFVGRWRPGRGWAE